MMTNTIPAYNFRIKSGVLKIRIRKHLPWYLFMIPRRFYHFKFQIVITSASDVVFKYKPFTLILTKEQSKEILHIVRSICNSFMDAVKWADHQNPNVRDLVYLKQTDFRDIPILMVIDSDQDTNKNRTTDVSRGDVGRPRIFGGNGAR